jgi:hypothetical protein
MDVFKDGWEWISSLEIVNNIIAKTSVGKVNKKAFRILYV